MNKAGAGGSDETREADGSASKWRWAAVWACLLAIPVAGFAILGEGFFDPWIEAAGGSRAAAAVACFSLLAVDVLLPVPSSFVAVVSGQRLGLPLGAALNWAGITLGHVIGYALARRWGAPIARRFIGERALERAARSSRLGATAALILTRPIPIVAEAMSMHAGLAGCPAARFCAVAALANIPHSVIYAWAGARAADAASINALVLAGVGLPTAAYLAFGVWGMRRGRGRGASQGD